MQLYRDFEDDEWGERRQRTVIRNINADLASEAVGPIKPRCEIFGLSKGQFSLIELIEHILDYTGPAHLVVSTWTAGGADIAHFAHLVADKRIQSAKWLLDASFPQRQWEYCEQLVEAFGVENLVFTSNHAKFVLFRNAEWNVVLVSSMNLNRNRRLEHYQISDDAKMLEELFFVAKEAFEHGATLEQTLANSDRADKTINFIAGQVQNRKPDIRAGGHPSIKGKR